MANYCLNEIKYLIGGRSLKKKGGSHIVAKK